MFLSPRRIALLFGMLLVSSFLGGCGSDSSSDANGKGSGGSSAEEGGISLSYDGKSIRADKGAGSVNPMMLGSLKIFHVTMMGGWVDPEGEPKFGLITTRLALMGDSETTVEVGSYTLEHDSDGMGMLSGPMSASLVIEEASLGLPDSLVATSGTLQVNSIELDGSSLEHISISFDGTFKNDSDDSDTNEYALSGTIDLPVE